MISTYKFMVLPIIGKAQSQYLIALALLLSNDWLVTGVI